MDRKIVVISGFSGVGKSTILKQLMKIKNCNNNFEVVKSYTSRPPRNDEDYYYFVSKEQFVEMEKQGKFLETTYYGDNWYGTPIEELQRILSENKTPVLEIETNGFQYITSPECGVFPKSMYKGIFIAADANLLIERLIKRNSETIHSLMLRMETAVAESEEIYQYDQVLINQDLDETIENLLLCLEGKEIKNSFNAEVFKAKMEFYLYDIEHGALDSVDVLGKLVRAAQEFEREFMNGVYKPS